MNVDNDTVFVSQVSDTVFFALQVTPLGRAEERRVLVLGPLLRAGNSSNFRGWIVLRVWQMALGNGYVKLH